MRAWGAALVSTALILAACEQATSGHGPSGNASTNASTSAPSDQGSAIAGGSGSGRCQTSQLKITLGPMNGATGNEIASVTMTNQSATSCYLGGYAGVELLDVNGNHLGDAQRSTDSFFGTYPAPHRVDIPPGQSTTFDLTWVGVDPCGSTPGWHPAYFRITPPGDYDSAKISTQEPGMSQMSVCQNSMTVHPVGSRPQQG
jgi:uncharacterized protein DUF4232